MQPLEFFRCFYWYEESRVAYLCADGKTVRPIPGMEGRFAAFVRQLRLDDPGWAGRLTFEGPAD